MIYVCIYVGCIYNLSSRCVHPIQLLLVDYRLMIFEILPNGITTGHTRQAMMVKIILHHTIHVLLQVSSKIPVYISFNVW